MKEVILGFSGETVLEVRIIGIALVRAHQKIERRFFISTLINDNTPRITPPISPK